MILYVYKLKNFNGNIPKNLPFNIKIQKRDKNKIKCSVIFDTFFNDVIISLKSNFLFIIANKKSEKRKTFKALHSIFNTNLSYFRPSFDEEYNFLSCCNDNISLKFIHDNTIVYNAKLTKEYFKKTLNDDYYFFEAKIGIDFDNCYFLYYGDTIKIKDKFNDHLDEILCFFENCWAVK